MIHWCQELQKQLDKCKILLKHFDFHASMLDRKFILENVDAVKLNCKNRHVTADVDQFVALERERKSLQQELEKLQTEANTVSKFIGQAKSDSEREAKKEEGRILRDKAAAVKTKLDTLEIDLDVIQRSIPKCCERSWGKRLFVQSCNRKIAN